MPTTRPRNLPSHDSLPATWTAVHDGSASLLVHTQHSSGSWPASPGFEPYGYSWLRDGSFIADGASAAGLHAEADAFHDWCERVLTHEEPTVKRAEDAAARGMTLDDSEYLPARFNLDGSRHHDNWWNFQVDGYGTWLWALSRHLERTGESGERWAPGARIAVRYLVATGLHSCRDWWEENRDETHVTTLAGVAAGLRAAIGTKGIAWPMGLAIEAERTASAAVELIERRGTRDGHFVKWLDGADVDASLISLSALYDLWPSSDPVVRATVDEIEARLTSGPGPTGVHRYQADQFYGGGQWPVLACLLATHHARNGHHERATELLDWVVASADDHLLLPEQTAPRLAPETLAEWEERWGPSAHPLLWSHGAFLSAVEHWRA